MSTIQSFRDLIVWQKSMRLVTEIYKITRSFPSEELYALTSQLRRCAKLFPAISRKVMAENQH
jgi:four helix bundle protein